MGFTRRNDSKYALSLNLPLLNIRNLFNAGCVTVMDEWVARHTTANRAMANAQISL
jgi:hypothetical protein